MIAEVNSLESELLGKCNATRPIKSHMMDHAVRFICSRLLSCVEGGPKRDLPMKSQEPGPWGSCPAGLLDILDILMLVIRLVGWPKHCILSADCTSVYTNVAEANRISHTVQWQELCKDHPCQPRSTAVSCAAQPFFIERLATTLQ